MPERTKGTVYTTVIEYGDISLGAFVFTDLDEAAECMVEMTRLKWGKDITIDVSDRSCSLWKYEHDGNGHFGVYIREKELAESAEEKLEYFREEYGENQGVSA